jgi:hypothetical protein
MTTKHPPTCFVSRQTIQTLAIFSATVELYIATNYDPSHMFYTQCVKSKTIILP